MLSSGTRIGSYEVVALIGAGGMGEVYRAHDTLLNRDVALKVLPEVFARDKKRMAGGPVPLDETLPIGRQVADAVEYAHDHNVMHRDLKPANIKVTPEGVVKVLDFGLAKALADEPTAEDMSNSPTLSMAATRPGVILGTAAYMAPEQAKGKKVDRRAGVG